MKATSDQIQGRGNMFKRFNQFIVAKIWGIRLRPTGAAFLGACAGLSLTASVLPTVISFLEVTDSFSARFDLAGFAVYAVMLWAVGGWAAQRTSNALGGAIVLGLVGLVSSVVFIGLAYGAVQEMLLFGGAGGLAYGALGGMLIATALAEVKETNSD